MKKKLKYYKGELIEFEVYKLVDFYDDILRTPTVPYEFKFDPTSQDNTTSIAFSLAETLTELGGLGLSANQVGLNYRICVLNLGKEIWTLFNPVVISKSEEMFSEFQEGCLSYPGLYVKIPRHKRIKIKFQAIGGQEVEQEFTGLTSVCLQHELDHLDGIIYTDRISPIKLSMAKNKINKNLRKIRDYENKKELIDKQTKTEEEVLENTAIEPKITIQEPVKKPLEKFIYNT